MAAYRVLVLGGYGFFGRRLVERLSRHPGLELLIAGRLLAQAQAVAERLPPGTAAALAFDVSAPELTPRLRALAPAVVVHTCGPFQGQDHRVAEACIAAGILPDSTEVRTAITVAKTTGYQGIFFEIKDRLEAAVTEVRALCETTDPMIEGSEGTQGYFWQNVENNRTSWRSDYMAALTAMTNAVAFWSATAAICTEVHHHHTQTGSLLTHSRASANIG
mgnify:CR=1 FL=1